MMTSDIEAAIFVALVSIGAMTIGAAAFKIARRRSDRRRREVHWPENSQRK